MKIDLNFLENLDNCTNCGIVFNKKLVKPDGKDKYDLPYYICPVCKEPIYITN